MKKKFKKFLQKDKKNTKTPRSKTVTRFWGLATRLEHRNVGGKKPKHSFSKK